MSRLQKIKFAVAALILCAGLFSSSAQAAAQKIATINLEQVFRNYYRTKIIDQNFSEQGKVYRNYIARQAEALKKDEAAYNQKLAASQNIALAPQEQQKQREEVEKLARELRMRRAELEQYAADRAKALQESAARERQKVLEEIRAEIRRRAAIDGYTLVLDSSGMSINETSLVLYSVDSIDITAKVLTELNRGAGKTDEKTQKQ
jgi:Skp family chaperone for outer membrane proteins